MMQQTVVRSCVQIFVLGTPLLKTSLRHSSNLSMNLDVYQLLILIIDSPRGPHLLTPWGSHSVPCALYLPPFHSTRYYFTINKFRRGVLWHGEGKT